MATSSRQSNQQPAVGARDTPISGSAVWQAADLADRDGWTYRLSAEHVADIEANLDALRNTSKPLSEITRDDFPLPSMADMLAGIAHEMGWGKGFALLSGLPIERYDREQARQIFYGIGTHLGVGVSQSHIGDYIGDVIDRSDPEDLRPYHNGGEFIMHRDPVDMVGLLTLRIAKWGGASRIISAATVHNVMLEEAPELMDPLYEGFHYWRLDQERADTDRWTPYKMPVFRFGEDGGFTAHYIPNPIDKSLERDGVEASAPAAKAVAKLKTLLWSRPELYFDMMFEPGDMQFVNNRLLMHGRTDYEDWPERNKRRHLTRLWLQMPTWGPPPANQLFYTNIDRAGGGIGAHARNR